MKKLLLIVLAGILCFGLVACNQEPSEEEQTTPPTETTDPNPWPTLYQANSLEMLLDDIAWSHQNLLTPPENVSDEDLYEHWYAQRNGRMRGIIEAKLDEFYFFFYPIIDDPSITLDCVKIIAPAPRYILEYVFEQTNPLDINNPTVFSIFVSKEFVDLVPPEDLPNIGGEALQKMFPYPDYWLVKAGPVGMKVDKTEKFSYFIYVEQSITLRRYQIETDFSSQEYSLSFRPLEE